MIEGCFFENSIHNFFKDKIKNAYYLILCKNKLIYYTCNMNPQNLFNELYTSKTENDVENILLKNNLYNSSNNWQPLGKNKSNFSIVKNQQSNPIAALIEKITNSIDAILTKQCLLNNIDPKSKNAPKSMQEAIDLFFPNNKNWNDIPTNRRKQAEELQIIADGPKRQTGVIIYDNGEGQHPKHFEDTFLSLIRGNKNNILFVQGKYNMGGSGGIVFCGKNRYQLIGSKRYDNTGDFGFTLIREHIKSESDNAKETWFEYLLIDDKIPSFDINTLDIGLYGRKFITGTVIKLYNYQFPSGYDAFTGPLTQSINEYLFKPALPILTKDTKERYPNNKVLENSAFGLSRRLLTEEKDYLEDKFSEVIEDGKIGKLKVSCFVFKRKVKSYDTKKTKEIIKDRYFKNRMSVLFTLNGQVHGHYTSEFITRSLKMNLLKNYLLIHVDCTEINYGFRKELFMASRDRLKEGEETQYLRKFLSQQLSKSGSRLKEIERRRRQAVNIDTSMDTKDLIKDLSKEMPLDNELMKLLSQTFKLDQFDKKAPKKPNVKKTNNTNNKEEVKFNPKRFPSFLSLDKKNKNGDTVIQIPKGGEKKLNLSTDVENDYFDRLDEPGELQISILGLEKELEPKESTTTREKPSGVENIISVTKSSPVNGIIKISLGIPKEMQVGLKRKVNVSLSAPGGPLEETFFVKITEKQKTNEKKEDKTQEPNLIGLPTLILAYKEKQENDLATWEEVEEATGQEMNYDEVLCLGLSGEVLEKIYVNMDSNVLKSFKSKNRTPNTEQVELANKKYFTSVYFHTLFLYTITLNRKFKISKDDEDGDIGTYLKDVFSNFYATFILNFGSDVLMDSIAE